jgi:hypothetical protein
MISEFEGPIINNKIDLLGVIHNSLSPRFDIVVCIEFA